MSSTPAPPYSALPRQPCLDDVMHACRWPPGFAVMQTTDGCTVGQELVRSAGAIEYDIVAAADNLPLAICRAAVCAASVPGDRPLLVL
jgi:hypothetical protein